MLMNCEVQYLENNTRYRILMINEEQLKIIQVQVSNLLKYISS